MQMGALEDRAEEFVDEHRRVARIERLREDEDCRRERDRGFASGWDNEELRERILGDGEQGSIYGES